MQRAELVMEILENRVVIVGPISIRYHVVIEPYPGFTTFYSLSQSGIWKYRLGRLGLEVYRSRITWFQSEDGTEVERVADVDPKAD